ncbi:MAG: hypothetical protein ACREX9_14905 [Gammaproteobacteria bacterium]
MSVGNAILDGEPVIALSSHLATEFGFPNKYIPSLAKIDTETGTVQAYKGYPYSSSLGTTNSVRIAKNSTHYFLGSNALTGVGILKIDKASLSLAKSIGVDLALPTFRDLAASEDKVFALATAAAFKWRLYCFSTDLSILWAKELPSTFGQGITYLAATPGAVYAAKPIIKTGKGNDLALFKFNAGDGSLVSAMTLGGTSPDLRWHEDAIGISIADKVTTTGKAESESFTPNKTSIVYMEQPEDFESNFELTGITDVSITTTDHTSNQGEVTITSTSADNGATVSDTDYGIKIPAYT